MILCLLRHGEATLGAVKDDWRTLTPTGRQQVVHVAEQLKIKLARIEEVVSSPLLRAAESATLAAFVLGFPTAISITALLRPESSVPPLEKWLNQHPQGTRLLVGHEPLLASLVTQLTGEPTIAFEKAQIIALTREQSGSWLKKWNIKPVGK